MSISTIVQLLQKLLGVILLLYSLILIPIGKNYFRQRRESSFPRWEKPDNEFIYFMYLTTYRDIVIPLLIGIGLILSSSFWLILGLVIAYLLGHCYFFPYYFTLMNLLIVASGWIYGGLVYSRFFSGLGEEWFYICSGIGALCMFLVYILIVGIIYGIRDVIWDSKKK